MHRSENKQKPLKKFIDFHTRKRRKTIKKREKFRLLLKTKLKIKYHTNVCLLKVVQISFSRLVKVILNFIPKITIHMHKCDLFILVPSFNIL
jgi:hypothetical protein